MGCWLRRVMRYLTGEGLGVFVKANSEFSLSSVSKLVPEHMPYGDEFYLSVYHLANRPFPSSLVPLFQNQSKCEPFI